jgi:hypothetical protein
MSTETNYVIIGGGIAGGSIAYHLADRATGSVTRLERQSLASETTAKSMALLGKQGSESIVKMKDYSFQLYNDFLSNARSNPAFHLIGSMGVATTPAGKSAITESMENTNPNGEHDSLLTGASNVPSELFLKDDIRKEMITPLLGLLGTVTGMIEVFQVITSTGASNARLMASGISKATIPTMTGLAVSLSGIFFINILERRGARTVAGLADSLDIQAQPRDKPARPQAGPESRA